MKPFSKAIFLSAVALVLVSGFAPVEPEKSKDTRTPQEKFAQEVLELTNKAREKEGLKPLRLDDRITKASIWMAEDMAKNNRFSHVDSLGRTPGQRIPEFGYKKWRRLTENIAAGYRDAEEVVEGWLESPSHRKNILDPEVEHMGLGFFDDPKSPYRYFWAQNFGAERK